MKKRMKSARCVLGLAAAVSLLSMSSYAQAADPGVLTVEPPTAGRLLNDMNQKKDQTAATPGAGTVEVVNDTKPELKVSDEMRVQVNDFKITGQMVCPEEKLKAMIADSKGKLLSLADLKKNADKLTEFLKAQGYMAAKVYLPVQDIKGGVVEYAVLAGRIGEIEVHNGTNIHQTVIDQQLQCLKKGSYIRQDSVERAVWLLSDLAGADAKVTIAAGNEPGTSKLTFDLKPYSGKNGLFYIDNYGSRSTGYNEYGISYDFLNPVHEGDHLALDFITTGRNLNNGSINYTIPVWKDGLTANLGFSSLSYLLGDVYSDLDAVGTAKVYRFGFDYAIQRTERHNLYAALHGEHSILQDEYRNLPTVGTYSDKQSNAAILSLYGNERDSKGSTNWRVDYKFGTLTFGTANTHTYFDGANTEGSYSKINANVLRRQSINNRLELWLSARGQYSSRNLDSYERMSLGGVSGVKAYPQGEASGDIGYFTRAELRWMLPLKKQDQGLYFKTYLEHGAVRVNKSGSDDGTNYRKLQGIGVGLRWERRNDWFIDTDYAWRLGAQRPTSDSSHSNGHFWIRGGVYF